MSGPEITSGGPAKRPASLVVAMVGAAVSSVVIIGFGVASLASGNGVFSIGIGLMLILYGLVVGLGAWLAHRRLAISRGVIVAPALLNLATAVSLFGGGDLAQSVGAAVAIAWFVMTIVAAVLPSTRQVLRGLG